MFVHVCARVLVFEECMCLYICVSVWLCLWPFAFDNVVLSGAFVGGVLVWVLVVVAVLCLALCFLFLS